jgi:hypothetical protein
VEDGPGARLEGMATPVLTTLSSDRVGFLKTRNEEESAERIRFFFCRFDIRWNLVRFKPERRYRPVQLSSYMEQRLMKGWTDANEKGNVDLSLCETVNKKTDVYPLKVLLVPILWRMKFEI